MSEGKSEGEGQVKVRRHYGITVGRYKHKNEIRCRLKGGREWICSRWTAKGSGKLPLKWWERRKNKRTVFLTLSFIRWTMKRRYLLISCLLRFFFLLPCELWRKTQWPRCEWQCTPKSSCFLITSCDSEEPPPPTHTHFSCCPMCFYLVLSGN